MIKTQRKYRGGKSIFLQSEELIFKWSSHSYTLQYLTNNFRLPCVVKCHVDSCSLSWKVLHFELSQPLLLHSKRSVKKVKAAVLKLDKETKKLCETGDTVVIPCDYTGWFTRLESPDEVCRPSSTIESVAVKDNDQVLVANSISCLCLTETEHGRQPERKQISSGEILQIKRTESTNNSNISSDSRYVVCSDEKDKEMFLPFSQNGKFYKVNKSLNNNGLFQAQDIATNRDNFPINVRHVMGEVPEFSSEYSSYLKCYDVIEEETVVASTLDDELLLLELQMKSPLKFYIALNEANIKQNHLYTNAFQNCEAEIEDYIRNIKFSFTLSPDSYSISNSIQSFRDEDSSSESFYTESDLEEEDAKSEFTINWDPADSKTTQKPETVNHNDVPRIFNSSINSAKSSIESNINHWNENPDTV